MSFLEKLSTLHGRGLAHGDIRLVNLLSTGFIMDFDFVRLDTYTKGLNQLSNDGRRHEEVSDAIANGTIGPREA